MYSHISCQALVSCPMSPVTFLVVCTKAAYFMYGCKVIIRHFTRCPFTVDRNILIFLFVLIWSCELLVILVCKCKCVTLYSQTCRDGSEHDLTWSLDCHKCPISLPPSEPWRYYRKQWWGQTCCTKCERRFEWRAFLSQLLLSISDSVILHQCCKLQFCNGTENAFFMNPLT